MTHARAMSTGALCSFCEKRKPLICFIMAPYYLEVEEHHNQVMPRSRMGCLDCAQAFGQDPDPEKECCVAE